MNDEDYGVATLSVLRHEPPAASKVEVVQAVREARRSRLRSSLSVAAIAVLAVGAAAAGGGTLARAAGAGSAKPKPTPSLPADPALPASCTVAALPIAKHVGPAPQGKVKSVDVSGADSTGHWLAGSANPYLSSHETGAVLWHNGRVAADIKGNGEIRLESVNSSGVAVGVDAGHPIYVHGSTESALKGDADPHAINNSGVVVGEADKAAVRWRSVGAQPERLPDVGGRRAEGAYLVGNDGLIIGNDLDRTHLLLWYPDGRTKAVELPSGMSGWHPGSYRNGWIEVTLDTYETFRYSPAADHWQRVTPRTGPGPDTTPVVDSSGKPLGGVDAFVIHADTSVVPVPSSTINDVPKIYMGTKAFQLPTLPGLTEKDGYTIVSMTADFHHIAGYTISKDADLSEAEHPLEWTCA